MTALLHALIFFVGCVFGSFLGAASYRIPRGMSLVLPRSQCPQCGRTLEASDLVPVLSYLLQRGRCAYCGQEISGRYPLIEVISGGLVSLFFLRYGLSWYFVVQVTLALWALLLAVIDLECRRLPNMLTISGMALGLGLNTVWYVVRQIDPTKNPAMDRGLLSSWGWAMLSPRFSPWYSLAGIAVGGGILWLLALLWRGGMGGGDVKFLAAIGSFLGPGAALLALFLGSLLGSVVGMPFLLSGRWQRGQAVPFGPFLATSAILIALAGPLL